MTTSNLHNPGRRLLEALREPRARMERETHLRRKRRFAIEHHHLTEVPHR